MDKNLVEESGDDSNDNEKKDVHVATALVSFNCNLVMWLYALPFKMFSTF